MRITYTLATLLLLIVATSCGTKKRVAQKKPDRTSQTKPISEVKTETPTSSDPRDEKVVVKDVTKLSYTEAVTYYIDTYSTIAKEEMLQYGIPASITLAQGILESGAGRGELTMKANNHFGIKCHTSWTGERVYHDDDARGECFRKYKDAKYSFRDHSLFLTGRSRYAGLFKLDKDDYKGWAKGLKKAGYATDPKYPNKLISIVERYSLDDFDREVLGTSVNPVSPDTSTISTYVVKKGDTLYSIAKKYNLTVETLKKYNGLRDNTLAIGQELYLHQVKN
ncbi:MAG: glucosaminidase domain-containing protein [Gilvibacter sp.]